MVLEMDHAQVAHIPPGIRSEGLPTRKLEAEGIERHFQTIVIVP